MGRSRDRAPTLGTEASARSSVRRLGGCSRSTQDPARDPAADREQRCVPSRESSWSSSTPTHLAFSCPLDASHHVSQFTRSQRVPRKEVCHRRPPWASINPYGSVAGQSGAGSNAARQTTKESRLGEAVWNPCSFSSPQTSSCIRRRLGAQGIGVQSPGLIISCRFGFAL